MREALEFMEPGGRGTKWHVLCCKEAVGACTSCGGSTMAYVTAWTQSSGRWVNGQIQWTEKYNSNTWVRACPLLLNESDDVSAGLVWYHELIHMVSKVGDASGTYSKLGAH